MGARKVTNRAAGRSQSSDHKTERIVTQRDSVKLRVHKIAVPIAECQCVRGTEPQSDAMGQHGLQYDYQGADGCASIGGNSDEKRNDSSDSFHGKAKNAAKNRPWRQRPRCTPYLRLSHQARCQPLWISDTL